MNHLTFFTNIKQAIDIYNENLIDFSLENIDHELESELLFNPNSDISTNIREIAYDIAERVLEILDEAGIYYRVLSQIGTEKEQLNKLLGAQDYAGLINGMLWIFSPVNGKALPDRVIDSTMLVLCQKIKDYLYSFKDLDKIELFSNPYQVHLNYLKNKFGGNKKDDDSFQILSELVSKQKASPIQINADYMICPDCHIKLGFHDQDHPNYCLNCGKRLKI